MKTSEDMNILNFRNFSMKHFLDSRYEYANTWVDDVIASQFYMYSVYQILKFFIFIAQTCKSISHIKLYRGKHYSAFIHSGYKASFTFFLLKYWIFVISVNKIPRKL